MNDSARTRGAAAEKRPKFAVLAGGVGAARLLEEEWERFRHDYLRFYNGTHLHTCEVPK